MGGERGKKGQRVREDEIRNDNDIKGKGNRGRLYDRFCDFVVFMLRRATRDVMRRVG